MNSLSFLWSREEEKDKEPALPQVEVKNTYLHNHGNLLLAENLGKEGYKLVAYRMSSVCWTSQCIVGAKHCIVSIEIEFASSEL